MAGAPGGPNRAVIGPSSASLAGMIYTRAGTKRADHANGMKEGTPESTVAPASRDSLGGPDRFLRLFADVRAGEGSTALLLSLNVFLILMAYYVLKPVREALILGEGTAAGKTYLSVVEVFLLALAVPLYGRLVRRLDRRRLINSVTAFFLVCLLVFYGLGHAGARLGIAFFLWISIFNMMIVAQFWSFANDIYTKDEGERLFPIIGFGASLGAVVGSGLAGGFIERIGVLELMLVGAGLLVVEVLVTNYVDARERGRGRRAPTRTEMSAAPPAKGGAFGLVFKTRYLLLIAFMLMLHNTVKTTGEYILGDTVRHDAIERLPPGDEQGVKRTIGAFYSSFYTWVNVVGLVLQLFVVSRIVRYLGVPGAILALPLVSLGAYGIIAVAPLLGAVFPAKVAENSTDYSLNNTVRNMLFLPCTPEQKYSAKQAIDSFFVRLGDVGAAGVVFVGLTFLRLGPGGFAVANALFVFLWLVLAWRIGRVYRDLSVSSRPPATSAPGSGH
jgi:AAA family ATP:ADP antiporter